MANWYLAGPRTILGGTVVAVTLFGGGVGLRLSAPADTSEDLSAGALLLLAALVAVPVAGMIWAVLAMFRVRRSAGPKPDTSGSDDQIVHWSLQRGEPPTDPRLRTLVDRHARVTAGITSILLTVYPSLIAVVAPSLFSDEVPVRWALGFSTLGLAVLLAYQVMLWRRARRYLAASETTFPANH